MIREKGEGIRDKARARAPLTPEKTVK